MPNGILQKECSQCKVTEMVTPGAACPFKEVVTKLQENQKSSDTCPIATADNLDEVRCVSLSNLLDGTTHLDPVTREMARIAELNKEANFDLDKIISID